MLKQAFALLLLLALAAQCFHKAIVVAGFYLNQAAIAKTLCVNKERPQLKCGGKCQLTKRLQQEEKEERQMPSLKGDGKEQVLSSKSFFGNVAFYSLQQPAFACERQTGFPVHQPREFFHPPGC